MDPKTRVSKTFDLVADGYDNPAMRFFPLAGEQMADRLKLQPGEQVLDIACGTGAFSVAAGQRVRPGGRVQAVDLSVGMLARARANVARMALDNVDFHNMDADALDFPADYFDAIGCSFGLFFLGDMPAAVSNWQRLLKPGGRLMFTSFAPSVMQPMTDMFFDELQEFGIEVPPPGSRGSTGRLPTMEFCQSLLTDAGYIDVICESRQLGYYLGSAEDWWEILWNAGLRSFLEQLNPDQLATLRTSHLEKIENLKVEDGIWMDVDIWFTGGVKPL